MSQITKEYLAPSKKLVDAVVESLIKRGDANRFDHLMVVVPTAESGRNLRLALAKAFPETGVLPPRVVQPSRLLTPADEACQQASEVELQAAFLGFLASKKSEIKDRGIWSLLFKPGFLDDARALWGFLDQLNEIWHALAGRGLLMCDVLKNPEAVDVLTGAVGCELERWEQLGDFETQFFAFLEAKGVCHYAKKVQLAVANPALPPAAIKEVVLPALVDPIQAMYPVLEKWQALRPELKITVLIHADESEADKFDAWGRPISKKWEHEILTSLKTADIFRSATNQALGEKVATEFCKIAQGQPLPALGLIDAGTFSDVQAALMTREKNVHNPERHALNVSSLGAIVDLVMSVWEKSSDRITLEWKEIAGLVRQHDVMMYLAPAGGALNRADILTELDTFANKFLPVGHPTTDQLKYSDKYTSFTNLSAALDKLKELFAVQKNLSDFISHTLQKLYAHATSNREFQAAAAAVRRFLNDLKSEEFQSLPPKEQLLIARPALARTNYQLEPEGDNVIKTLGWLELAWTSKEQIALVGFHEGCVPDALIGHAFLPNTLRTALGLTSNDQRFARDVYLLKELLACREENDVKFFVALANSSGDIQKPSRLLFLCEENEMPVRARHLFDEIQADDSRVSQSAELVYKLKKSDVLEEAQKNFRGRLSPSAIDTYIKCPFTYLLQKGLYLKGYKPEEEMAANEFGTLAHAILQEYVERQIVRTKNGESQLVCENLIREELLSCYEQCVALYGTSLTANFVLQLEALKSRILAFAPIQHAWAADGWDVFAAEYEVNDPEAFEVDGQKIALKGFIDRIDRHRTTGAFRIIDYKTWDTGKKAEKKVFADEKEEEVFADEMGFWKGPLTTRQRSSRRFLSVQLPLYATSFERLNKCKVADMCYLVLGSSADDVCVRLGTSEKAYDLMSLKEKALQTAQRAVEGIVHGDFWHFGPSETWKKYDFEHYFKGLKPEAWEEK